MIIKDWWYAIKVCRKYGITWNPFCLSDCASVVVDLSSLKAKIKVNPFYSAFLTSFMHEVGHARRWIGIAKQCTYMCEFNSKTSCILKEEYVAWKFSKRTLGAKFDKQRARWCFKTYWRQSAKNYNPLYATDKYYAYDRRIEK